MPRHLTETVQDLIIKEIKAKIAGALAGQRSIHPGGIVTTEVPPTSSYFIYPDAHGYQCPAIFVEDDGTDFRQEENGANHINASMSINVTVKVEDRDKYLCTKKAQRYQSALHQILDQTQLASADQAVRIIMRVKRIKPSGLYSYPNSEKDSTASFYFEYMLNLVVEYIENF